jgi:hypothetical protein
MLDFSFAQLPFFVDCFFFLSHDFLPLMHSERRLKKKIAARRERDAREGAGVTLAGPGDGDDGDDGEAMDDASEGEAGQASGDDLDDADNGHDDDGSDDSGREDGGAARAKRARSLADDERLAASLLGM